MQKCSLVITALAVMLSLSGCPTGMAARSASVKLLNASESDVTDLRLLFRGETLKKLYAGQEYTLRLS
ncbi:MAG: hypothetical protein LBC53_01455 [Spirochaetaceae bacterium]|jgi:hypothetical protein|nr:hypothetical protein [Spirochaetaceae bacterium]